MYILQVASAKKYAFLTSGTMSLDGCRPRCPLATLDDEVLDMFNGWSRCKEIRAIVGLDLFGDYAAAVLGLQIIALVNIDPTQLDGWPSCILEALLSVYLHPYLHLPHRIQLFGSGLSCQVAS